MAADPGENVLDRPSSGEGLGDPGTMAMNSELAAGDDGIEPGVTEEVTEEVTGFVGVTLCEVGVTGGVEVAVVVV